MEVDEEQGLSETNSGARLGLIFEQEIYPIKLQLFLELTVIEFLVL